MRITIAANSLLPADKEGGPAHSNFYLARALRGAGADVRVVATDRNGPGRLTVPLDQWIEREGVPVFYARTHGGPWIRSPAYAAAVHDAVARSDVCVMCGIFWNHTGLAAVRACRHAGVPFATLPRGLLSPWALRHKGLKKWLYWHLVARRLVQWSAGMIALSQQEREDIEAMGIGVPVEVVPNGAFVEDMANLAGRLEPPSSSASYVLFLGRIHAKKGLDILLPAFERIAGDHPGLALVVAGSVDPAYAAEFERLLARNTARERIRLVGNVSGEEKARWLAGASLFALTSYSEGLPVAVLEALSAGVPVVITPGCNLPEVTEAEAGIEVPPEAGSVAKAIARLAGDAALRRRMAFNARQLARDRFAWESVGRRVLGICEVIAASRPTAIGQSVRERDAT